MKRMLKRSQSSKVTAPISFYYSAITTTTAAM